MIIRAVDVEIKWMFIKCKPPSGQMSMTLNVNALLLVPTTQSTPPVKQLPATTAPSYPDVALQALDADRCNQVVGQVFHKDDV